MLVVHHLSVSQSDRIVWLCEELNVAYELKRYLRDPGTNRAPAEYRRLHPFGTAPVITDGDLTLGESGAIIEYIIHTQGDGRLSVGSKSPDYPAYLFWLHFANGSFMPSIMIDMIANKVGKNASLVVLDALLTRSTRAFEMLETRLTGNQYLAGHEFSAADIINFFPLTTMRAFVPKDLTPYPHILAYIRRVAERPAYRKAMDKTDPGFSHPLG